MSALIWLLPIAMFAFVLWVAYDCGVDTGYDRCWHEHHPVGSERTDRDTLLVSGDDDRPSPADQARGLSSFRAQDPSR